jgi:hypothetical protein
VLSFADSNGFGSGHDRLEQSLKRKHSTKYTYEAGLYSNHRLLMADTTIRLLMVLHSLHRDDVTRCHSVADDSAFPSP